MASNPSAATMESSSNPCCIKWQAKYTEMEERRLLLRNGLKTLKSKVKSLESEKQKLQKALKDQQNRAVVLEEEKEKEASLRTSLEHEVDVLRSQICSNETDVNSKNDALEKETLLFQDCISEKEEEIERLKMLLTEENRGSASLKIENETLQKALKDHQDQTSVLEEEKEKEASLRISLEHEVAELKSKICSTETDVNCKNNELVNETLHLRECISEKEGEIERLNKLLTEENRGSTKGKKVSTSEKKKIAELQKNLKSEKSRADEACKLADAAKRKSEEDKILVETLNNEVKNISQKLEETNRMLENEKQMSIVEKKKADEEKTKADELRRIAEVNEQKAADEKSLANNLSTMLEEEKKKVENLQKELDQVISIQRSTLSSQLDELSKNLEIEKRKVVMEKECAASEKIEKEAQKKAAEASMKKAVEEKHHADKLLQDLRSCQQKIENLQVELTKVNHMLEAERLVSAKEKQCADDLNLKLKEQKRMAAEVEKSQMDKFKEKLETEKKKASSEKKRADLELSAKEELKRVAEANAKKATEEKLHADKLSQDLQHGKHKIDSLQGELNKVGCMLEGERLVLAKERNAAESLKSKLEEQTRITEETKKRAMALESQNDKMIQELENIRKKLNSVENKSREDEQSRGLTGASSVAPEFFLKQHNAKISLLQEQLKFEKKRVKHYKEVAKLEKDLKSASQLELLNVKQEFQSLLHQMDMLSDTFGARNHINKKRRLNVQNLELPERMPESLPRLDFCCDAELRLSSLSSRDTSSHPKPNTRLVDAEQLMESPSGMKINLDPLLGGPHGDIFASSGLNSNTASFSDEQLLGSQERVAGTLTTLTGLASKNPVPQKTIAGWNDGERVVIVAENNMNPVEFDSGHVKKKRKVIQESKLIGCVQSQDENVNQDARTKLLSLDKVLAQPRDNQMEKVNLLVTSNNGDSCGNFYLSGEKKKSTYESQALLQQVDNSTVLTEMNTLKITSPRAMNTEVISQPNESFRSGQLFPDQEELLSFEREMNGNYMALLDLDNPMAEKHFRLALELPLSPTLPDLDPREFDKVEMQNLGVAVCDGNSPTDSNGEHSKIPKFCVVFSDMGDIGSITRIFGATTACMARLRSPLKTRWLVEDILQALVSEHDLVSREMVCVFFSLLLLNFVAESHTQPMDFKSLLCDTFSANLQSVLVNMETRPLFAKVCSFSDLLSLSENFLLNKKILTSSLISDGPNCGDLRIEFLHQGENNVLRPSFASTNMVLVGSIVLASISIAADFVGSICQFSLKAVRTRKDDCSLTLLILHTFAYVCGEEYFTNSKYCAVMDAIKVIVASFESSSAISESVQLGDALHHCFPCDKCPFTESPVCLDDVSSKLVQEVNRCTKPHSQPDTFDSCFLNAVLCALELLAAHMGWGLACDKVLSKLFVVLESSDPLSITSTAVVALLGNLGRLGVKTCGYDDPGVQSIVQRLMANLHKTSSLKYSTFPMAIVHSLTQLHPNGAEGFLKNSEESGKGVHSASSKAASDILRTVFSSSLSGKPTSAVHNNCMIPDIIA